MLSLAKKKFIILFLCIVTIGTITVLIYDQSAVKPFIANTLNPRGLVFYLKIDGTDYGEFSSGKNIKKRLEQNVNENQSPTILTLNRNFVTDHSLYSWAKKTSSSPLRQNNLEIQFKENNGDVYAHYLLKSCKPLSWAIEVNDTHVGGYHERVEVITTEIINLLKTGEESS